MSLFLEKLARSPMVFDGAMGTMLYERGVFINTCYDLLNITRPDLVRGIHKEYVDAGADVIETNTFGANRLKLREHGLGDDVKKINTVAVRLAREAATEDVLVAGSVGPCVSSKGMWREGMCAEIRAALEEQIQALESASVDLIILETFIYPDELQLAAELARKAGLSVVASFAPGEQAETALGGRLEPVATRLERDPNVDVIGLNCGAGPQAHYDAAERMLPIIKKPLVIMPNAGRPQNVSGRMMYMSSPEYFTEYAKRFIELGVRGVGGCCGTTPAHIRVMAKAVKAVSKARRSAAAGIYAEVVEEAPALPLAEKSELGRKLSEGIEVTSVEIVPPKSTNLAPMIRKARLCKEHGVDCINIPDGPRATSRVSPLVSAMMILNRIGIEPILHYCCRDRNLIGMQSDLLGAEVASVRNLLIITGDPPKLGDYPDATGVFDVDSIGLTSLAWGLNHGRDVGGTPLHKPTGLLIGVGANPCAVSMETELDRLKAKIEAGAEFAITQPIFDPESLFRFLDKVEAFPRQIPFIAGIWPLTSFKNAEFMRNEVPGVVLPDRIMERMAACKTKEQALDTGIIVAREICRAISARVAGFQASAPFGKVEIALRALGKMDP